MWSKPHETVIIRNEYQILPCYRIGLPSNIATPLVLIVRIKLLCSIDVHVFEDLHASLRILFHKLMRDNRSIVYSEMLDPAILRSVQDKIIKHCNKKIITITF